MNLSLGRHLQLDPQKGWGLDQSILDTEVADSAPNINLPKTCLLNLYNWVNMDRVK